LSSPSSSTLDLSKDGNLLLFQGSSKNIPVWSTNLTFHGSNLTEIVLGEEGNFVLKDRWNASFIFWESFHHPTDTWLPSSKLWIYKVTQKQPLLISWKNSEDLTPSVFSVQLEPDGSKQLVLEWNISQIYWRSVSSFLQYEGKRLLCLYQEEEQSKEKKRGRMRENMRDLM
jgi:hypothetical protein